ncbi:hypothetical protein [Persicobacter diffluens]|uniref:Lipoprotein n=1 Tax=Persicobacter diffluens TaxID=981 RepID=A0AAN4VXF1_9BACT|nr:hypothetical protein PEDI_17740 [Persicobacter diffluens]
MKYLPSFLIFISLIGCSVKDERQTENSGEDKPNPIEMQPDVNENPTSDLVSENVEVQKEKSEDEYELSQHALEFQKALVIDHPEKIKRLLKEID